MLERVAALEGLERIRSLSRKMGLTVVRSSDELSVWQAAEALAKALRVPVLDLSGDEAELREVDDLDLPLRERLKKAGPIEAPGPPPDNLEVELTHSSVEVVWRHIHPAMVVPLIMAPCSWIAASITMIRGDPELGWILVGLGLFWVPIAGLLPHGRHSLSVDPQSVRLWYGGLLHHTVEIPTAQVEMVRVNSSSELWPSLNLMTDTRILRCRMSAEQGDWSRRAIQHVLGGGSP